MTTTRPAGPPAARNAAATTAPAAGDGPAAGDDPALAERWGDPARPAPTRLRRRPALLVAGLCLTALGGILAAWLYSATTSAVTIVAVARPVERGQVLAAEDLTTARIVPDARLDLVAGERLTDLVGRRAAVDLPAGGVVTGGSVTTAVVPDRGESVVGVTLTRAQLPVEPLVAGDTVRLVGTPRAQDDPPVAEPPVVGATVHRVTAVPETGETVVDVLVPDGVAPGLAAQAATGRVALVLDSRARG